MGSFTAFRMCIASMVFGASANTLERRNLVRHSHTRLQARDHEASHVTSQKALDWLKAHKRSNDDVPEDYLNRSAVAALAARNMNSFAKGVPADMFFDYVLPYAHFDEKADEWRPYFLEKLGPIVRGKKTLKDAAEALIPRIWTAFGRKIEFKGNQTPQVLAPMSDLLKKGYGSCTGMSIFLADGLRSVGIPARIAGVAEWNRPEKGNHNWVEVHDGQRWNFVDAVPSAKVEWNKAWFTEEDVVQKSRPRSKSGVYTPTWDKGHADAYYVITWRKEMPHLPAIELTESYAGLPQTKMGQ